MLTPTSRKCLKGRSSEYVRREIERSYRNCSGVPLRTYGREQEGSRKGDWRGWVRFLAVQEAGLIPVEAIMIIVCHFFFLHSAVARILCWQPSKQKNAPQPINDEVGNIGRFCVYQPGRFCSFFFVTPRPGGAGRPQEKAGRCRRGRQPGGRPRQRRRGGGSGGGWEGRHVRRGFGFGFGSDEGKWLFSLSFVAVVGGHGGPR